MMKVFLLGLLALSESANVLSACVSGAIPCPML